MAFSLKDLSQVLTGGTSASAATGGTAATMKRGSTGESVTGLQEKLQQAGLYRGELDGIYGAKTARAVRSFQKANGLPQTGEADDATAAAVAQSITARAQTQRQRDGFETTAPTSARRTSARPRTQAAAPTTDAPAAGAATSTVSASTQSKLDAINGIRLRGGAAHTCTGTTELNLRRAGMAGVPTSTSADPTNNPRGMMVQMLRSNQWQSLSVPGATPTTITSPGYGTATASVMSGADFNRARAAGQIPEGAVIFQSRAGWDTGSRGSRGNDVGIAHNGGIFNYQQMTNVYTGQKQVVVLLPQ